MKILTLLRHAKSGWDDPAVRDFDRPLNRRGRRAARAIGEAMRTRAMRFDHVLASPARRVVETIEEVARAYGRLSPDYEPRIYLASAQTLIELVRGEDDRNQRLLLVGHNPGMEDLTLLLAAKGGARGEVEVKYPTGAVAQIALPADHWRDVEPGSGSLACFIRPRDLDPTLGPDSG
jgi:phosphohistidine phosphatase